ncbi:HlyD family type I secretion periplasmic adaptor subunit [Rhodobacter sp. KR11]|uniref:HlyD family type I secretion periplasmic adaptor subunit n=1 Tax=Rhodobacter sp. KR11 TaxID=2974588 RepID=UPI0022217538|nr:HlyD family type I secretion periplasmic adaptor subunit [Rhodobacter sp. KR11]MCW1920278.1 HlyD family type I secretion periplasmic adaptor subunit [Rhodobacter sp. KR11]
MKIDRSTLDFQPDLVALVAEPPPFVLRLWPYLAAGLFVALVTVASLVRLDIVVTGQGRLAADVPPTILAPMSRAVLRELLVRPGDQVVAGQVLARLDATLPAADLAALRAQTEALRATAARLQADLDGATLAAATPALGREALVQAEENALSQARRDEALAVRAAARDALAAERLAGPGLAQRLDITREVEAMRNELAARQTGSRLAQLQAEADRIASEEALAAHEARLKELTARLAAAEAGLAAFDSDARRSDLQDLADISPRLAAAEEALSKAERLADLTALTAPGPGTVVAVAEGGPGSSLAEGAMVVVLVPSDVPLVAEVTIRSADAGSAAVGDPVDVKIDAFPWRRHGSLTGQLLDISSASFTPEGGGEARHTARVALSGDLTNLAPGAGLLPGMTLTADVKTGTRSLLDYFLDPLMRGLNEALREP